MVVTPFRRPKLFQRLTHRHGGAFSGLLSEVLEDFVLAGALSEGQAIGRIGIKKSVPKVCLKCAPYSPFVPLFVQKLVLEMTGFLRFLGV